MPDFPALRRQRFRDSLASQGIDCALVTSLVDVRWLTGFTGSYGVLLVTPDAAIIATDGRYTDQVAAEVQGLEIVIGRQVHRGLLRMAKERGHVEVAVDEDVVTVGMLKDMQEHSSVVPTKLGIAELRKQKDSGEIEALRQACRISDLALADVVSQRVSGRTEREIAIALERRMIDLGAEAIAFETIVASGPNSAIPHHHPTDREISSGDLLKIDFGARVAGYHADETRTFVVGPPHQWQVEIHQVVFAAQSAGIGALAHGVELKAVDAAARSVIEQAGYGPQFTHGLGHGVGLVIHEEPFFAATSTGILNAGTPVTVEPGIYLPGRGGVRIEDTLLVGTTGAESLTKTERDLVVLS